MSGNRKSSKHGKSILSNELEPWWQPLQFSYHINPQWYITESKKGDSKQSSQCEGSHFTMMSPGMYSWRQENGLYSVRSGWNGLVMGDSQHQATKLDQTPNYGNFLYLLAYLVYHLIF